MKRLKFIIFFIIIPVNLYSMHIMEGFLSLSWAGLWWAVIAPLLYLGIARIKRILTEKPELKMLLAMAGAFAFVLSSLKLPSVTGSCSHPTGVGLGTLMFGPFPVVVLGFIVLLFQCLLLAHGGLTTLGANTFSMAVCGPFISFLLYKLCNRFKLNNAFSIFIAAFFGDTVTYIITSIQLALAHPDIQSGVTGSMVKFLSIFAFTQIPIGISEGILTVIVINILTKYAPHEMQSLSVLKFNKDIPQC